MCGHYLGKVWGKTPVGAFTGIAVRTWPRWPRASANPQLDVLLRLQE
jgi:hypothetical protein